MKKYFTNEALHFHWINFEHRLLILNIFYMEFKDTFFIGITV